MKVIEVLESNSTLRRLRAVQKRHLESLAEGPFYYSPGQRLWRFGTTVDKAFIIVAGTVSFVAKRRNVGSVAVGIASKESGVDVCLFIILIMRIFIALTY